jgi:hypothetical protein
LIASLVVCELTLRLVGCDHLLRREHQSAAFLSTNPYWGVWHFADDRVEHGKGCFETRYETNDYGMKSPEVRPGAKAIALLGDSFVEGFGNDNAHSVDAVMRRLLAGRYDVLNFGVSGGFTTIDELVLYDDFVRYFHPKVVVLFFSNYNDLEENLDPAKSRYIDRDLRLVYPRPRSFEEIVSVVRTPRAAAAERRADRRFCLGRLYRIAEKVIRLESQMLFNLRWDFRDELARPYLPDEDDGIRRSWAIVETSLARIHDIAAAEATTFVVVDIADPYQLDPNWLRVASLRSGKTLDPTHPNRRLGEICRKLGVPYYDMYPDAKQHLESNRLRFPYLSFSCDRHYNRDGQELMGRLVTRYLEENRLLDR